MVNSKNKNEPEYIQTILEQSRKEINFIASLYKWLIGGCVILIGIGMTFTFKTFNDLRNEVNEVRNESTTKVEKTLNDLETKINTSFNKVQKDINEKIVNEFENKNIRTIIEKQAKKQVDETADKLIAEKINATILPKINHAEQKLKEIQNAYNNLQSDFEFNFIVQKANNQDRNAYDRLYQWSNDPNYKFQSDAKKAYQVIVDAHSSNNFLNNDLSKENFKTLTLQEIKNLYSSIPDYRYSEKLSLMELIKTRTDFSKFEKMLFYIEIIKNDKDLENIELASYYLNSIEKHGFKTLEIHKILEWWKKNKDNFNN